MAYEFEILGWEDWAGEVHWGTPDDADLPDIAGTFSRFWDDETGDEHHHWVYGMWPATSWQEWYDDIADSIEDHGYSMA